MASQSSSGFLFLCLLSSPFLSNANTNAKLGFTMDLIHRDSPQSPFYNPSETSFQRTRNSIRRSINRVSHFSAKDASTEITWSSGDYLMSVSLGTPPFPVMAIADTGSDLIWTQCKPCDECYEQADPLFDPKESSTYREVSCSSSQCDSLQNDGTCSSKDSSSCSYAVSYGDNSYTKGNLATDTLTLGSNNNRPVQLKNIVIGCGHSNNGKFKTKDAGIVGLGGGPLSLISQLGESIDAGKYFSYCLVPPSSENGVTSKINFGTNAVVSGTGAVSTPLVTKAVPSYYHLTLESVSVGSKNFKYPSSDSGNIIIDSGTTLTLLQPGFYSEVEAAVASSINAVRKNDPEDDLSLCYSADTDLKVPDITFHFDGADVKLDVTNSFIRPSKDLFCFAFHGSEDTAIYGNVAQKNFLVGYNTVYKTVSFKPADCATL
ncbi:unnamed protein product [Microthlaspi erraticum]|uniref:Peptidase A1 domain-containing protein n=1 Tax=Microthlaspi erraticum TaxID=1685480 RepID=A0A6D2HKY5_9BRAS|nr:unnamed protein product [Microthlaspi erraticum]